MCTVSRVQKRALGLLGLELEVDASHLIQSLGTELRTSAKQEELLTAELTLTHTPHWWPSPQRTSLRKIVLKPQMSGASILIPAVNSYCSDSIFENNPHTHTHHIPFLLRGQICM